ncbi:hypothetical protein [Mesohalobacter salilacus]|uniref:hypothetical protein n=1 Tax=Mesohalobacter salilacus TaxID=2491711 RepID=UPI0026A7BBE5
MKNISLLLFLFPLMMQAQNMDNSTLNTIIQSKADEVQGQNGQWQFKINERVLICVTDTNHNRMRIITPIVEVEKLNPEEILSALAANFHTALDVKYAISDDIMWSVFIHPLKELSDAQASDAIEQVYSAAETFGRSYSSTNLVFPGSQDSEDNSDEETVPLKQG